MPVRKDAARGLGVLFLLLGLVLVLAGCELIVEELQNGNGDTQRGAASASAAGLPDYDVAVSAIDFDPPLKRENLLFSQKQVKLLAAVENKGTRPLTQLVVEAQIASQKGEFSAHDEVQLERLSPGETKVVEFGGVTPATTLPKSPSYRIRVTVESEQPNSGLRSNSREVIVKVSDSAQD